MSIVARLSAAPRESVVLGIAVAAIAVAVGFQTTAKPELVLAAAAGVAIAAIVFVDLILGLLILTVLTFFELVPGFGAGDFTLVKIVGFLLALSWLARVIDRSSGTRSLFDEYRFFPFAVIAFALWAGTSAAWAIDPDLTISEAQRLVFVAVLTFITYSAIREPKHLRWVMWAYLLGAFLTTAYGMVEGLAIGRDDRLVGGILNPNQLAAVLVPAVIFGVFLLPSTRAAMPRLVLAISITTCLAGLMLTQSRGAFVGFAVALVFSLFAAGPVRPAVIVLSLAIVAGGVGYYVGFTSADQRERLSSLSAKGSSGRADEWRVALAMADDHPLMGVGLSNFGKVVPRYLAETSGLIEVRTLLKFPPPHNTYLQVLAELGAPGVILFGLVLGGALAIGLRAVKTLARGPDRSTEILARGVLVGYVALLALSVFNNGLVHKELWLMIGLLCSLPRLARETSHDHGTPARAVSPLPGA